MKLKLKPVYDCFCKFKGRVEGREMRNASNPGQISCYFALALTRAQNVWVGSETLHHIEVIEMLSKLNQRDRVNS